MTERLSRPWRELYLLNIGIAVLTALVAALVVSTTIYKSSSDFAKIKAVQIDELSTLVQNHLTVFDFQAIQTIGQLAVQRTFIDNAAIVSGYGNLLFNSANKPVDQLELQNNSVAIDLPLPSSDNEVSEFAGVLILELTSSGNIWAKTLRWAALTFLGSFVALSVFVIAYTHWVISAPLSNLFHAITTTVNTGVPVKADPRLPRLSFLALQFNMMLDRLSQTETRFRSLVDNAADGISVFDRDIGVFVEEANPRLLELFGCTREQLLGKLGPSELSPEFQPDGRSSNIAAMKYVEKALAGDPQHFEWTHRNIRGENFPTQITLVRYPHPTRRLVRASILDLTEQKEAERQHRALEEQLARSHRLEVVGQMTGGAAHDFNNLLGVLLGNLELLNKAICDDNARRIIKNATDAIDQGAGLTRAMLSYANQAELHPEIFRLSEIVKKVDGLIGLTLPARIELITQFEDDCGFISADAAGTESAIMNLIINARDAISNNGKLIVSTSNVEVHENNIIDELTPGSYVLLCVRDTGDGIPDDVLKQIFDPFFTTKGFGQNSGMGLSMVQGFMTQSGGDLRVDTCLGAGTAMKLYFPKVESVIQESERLDTETTGMKPGEPESSGTRILLVEDNVSLAQLMVLALEQAGHSIQHVDCAYEAIREFDNAGGYDLLVSDIAIPGKMQGPQLAEHLRMSQRDLPVIFISGYAFGLENESSVLSDKDQLLIKPFSIKHFLETIETTIEKRLPQHSESGFAE